MCSKWRNKTKTSEKEPNGMEISNLPNKEFKVMIMKMLTEPRRRMDEQSEKINKELERELIRAE